MRRRLRAVGHRLGTGAAAHGAGSLVAVVFGLVGSFVTGLGHTEVKSNLERAPVSQTVVCFSVPYLASDFATYDASVRGTAREVAGDVPADVTVLLASDDAVAFRNGDGAFSIPVVAASGPDAASALTLVAGRRPAGPAEVAVPEAVARDQKVAVGSTLDVARKAARSAGTSESGSPTVLTVVGVYRDGFQDAAVWQGLPDDAFQTRGSTPRAVLVVGGAAPVGGLPATAAWTVQPHIAAATPAQLSAMIDRVIALPRPQLPAGPGMVRPVDVASALTLEPPAAARAVLVGESAIALPLGILALLAVTAMVRAARVTADRRRTDLTLERSRGASARALIGGMAVDGLGFAVVAGTAVTAAIGASPAVGLTVGGILLLQAVMTILACAPDAVEREPGAGRRRRPARTQRFQRAGVDLGLVAVAGWGVVELRHYHSPFTGAADGSLDPVLIVVPSVVVAALAVLALRLLPPAARVLDGYARRRRTLIGAFGAWQVSRRTSRLGGGVLLASMAVSVGALAVTAPVMRDRAIGDQSAFEVGAPVRADGAWLAAAARHAAYAGLPGVSGVTPMWSLRGGVTGSDGNVGPDPITVVGVGTAAAGRVMTQGGGMPTADQLAELRTGIGGLALGGEPVRLRIGVSGSAVAGASAQIALEDADGHIMTLTQALPALTAADQTVDFDLTAGLPAGSALSYPLRFQGIAVSLPVPDAPAPALIVVDRITGIGAGGAASDAALPGDPSTWRTCGIRAVRALTADFSDPTCDPGSSPDASTIDLLKPGYAHHGSLVLAFDSGQLDEPGLRDTLVATAPVAAAAEASGAGPNAPLPALVTPQFLQAAGVHVGDQVDFVNSTYGSAHEDVTLSVVGVVGAVPGFPPGQATAVTDLAALGDALFQQDSAGISGESWLLATDSPATVARALADRPELGAVTTRDATTAALRADSFRTGAQRLLIACALLAPLFAMLGFVLDSLASLRERSVGFAALRAFGMRRRQLLAALWIEQGVVSGLAAVAGVVIGVLVATLTEPLLATSPDGSPPFPAMRVFVPWLRAAGVGAAAALGITLLLLLVARLAGRLDLARVLRAGDDA